MHTEQQGRNNFAMLINKKNSAVLKRDLKLND